MGVQDDSKYPVLTTLINDIKGIKDEGLTVLGDEQERKNNENNRIAAEQIRQSGYTEMDGRIDNAESSLALVNSSLNEKAKQVDLITTNANVTANTNAIALKANTADVNIQIASVASGSPKPYATLSAIQAAFPTGDSRNYLNVADGKWYYWNGSAWTAGGTYQSTGVADKSIAPKHLTFIPLSGIASKNLFNKDTITVGYFVQYWTGALATSVDYDVSDYIEILPSTAYYKNTWGQFAFYDVNKTYISGLSNAVYSFTTPSNAKYVRISLNLTTALDNPNTAQLELGSVGTSYESYAPKLDSLTVKDGTISKSMLSFVPAGMPSKNLFNKYEATTGYYVSMSDGELKSNSACSTSNFIPISASTSYIQTGTQQFAFYDKNRKFISGGQSATLTTPPNAVYMRITVDNTTINTFQLELGSTSTSYVSGLPTIYREQIVNLSSGTGYSNLVVVAKTGGDYATIMGAVNSITDSSSTKRYVILIMPGTYEEAISIDNKYIDLVGLNLGSVIITEKSGQYYTPPIEMSSRNNLKNLIIIASHENVGSYTGEPSYAVHHDYDGEGENYIDNCKLISYQSSAFGCGAHNNQQIHLKNCELITNTTGATYASGGMNRPALLYHPYPFTATNQKLIVDNCRLKSNTGKVLSIIDSNNNGTISEATADNRDTTVSFYNNIFWSEDVAYGKTNVVYAPDTSITQPGCIDGYIKLTKDSFGNNITEVNA